MTNKLQKELLTLITACDAVIEAHDLNAPMESTIAALSDATSKAEQILLKGR